MSAKVRVCAETGQIQPILPDLYRCRESREFLSCPKQQGATMNLKPITAAIILAAVTTQPAHAIDCTKAETKVEKAICASQELIAKDKALNESYAAALKVVKADDHARLMVSQREWARYYASDEDSKFSIGSEIDVRTGLLDSLRSKDLSIAQHFAKELLVENKNGQPTYFDITGPLKFNEIETEGETWNVSIPNNDDPFEWDEGSKRLFTALKAGGSSDKIASDLQDYADIGEGYEVKQTDFNKDGIPDFIVHINVRGNTNLRTSFYYVGTSAKPLKVKYAGSIGGGVIIPDAMWAEDRLAELNGKPFAVNLQSDGYRFVDLSALAAADSFLEMTTQNTKDFPRISECKTPGCAKMIADIGAMTELVHKISNAPFGHEKFEHIPVPANQSWVLSDHRTTQSTNLRHSAFTKLQSKIKLDTQKKPEYASSFKEEDLGVADVDNDGTPDIYVSYVDQNNEAKFVYVSGTAKSLNADLTLPITQLDKDFKGYDPKMRGKLEETNQASNWSSSYYFIFVDDAGETHVGRFGDTWWVGGSEDCCNLEIRTIKNGELKLDYFEETRLRLKVTNIMGFGNQ